MTPDLDKQKTEILECLGNGGFVIFHGTSRLGDTSPITYWDAGAFPDFRLFLEGARQTGVKLIVFHAREFSPEDVDEALEELEECSLGAEEHRTFERRLREMRAFEGFTCAIEISFDHQGRTYMYEQRAEWYDEFLDAIDEIQSSIPDEGGSGESMGGYFSRN